MTMHISASVLWVLGGGALVVLLLLAAIGVYLLHALNGIGEELEAILGAATTQR